MNNVQKFAQEGYIVESIDGLSELIKETLNVLMIYVTKGKSEFVSLNYLGDLLLEVFKEDTEKYIGLLRAVANSPTVQSFSSLPGIISLTKSLGVKEPTLVTPPILHVVKEELVLDKEKVFTPPHQDVVSTRGSVGQLVIWIPLHEITADNYGIEAWPGSHLNGQLDNIESAFGHKVSSKFIPDEPPKYITIKEGEVIAFSQYLIHKTATLGNFRLAVSFRFNDALDLDWERRKYFSAFERIPNGKTYTDSREKAPQSNRDYFSKLV